MSKVSQLSLYKCTNHEPLVGKLVQFRGLFWKKASQWPSIVNWTIRNLKSVVHNFVKGYEGIYGLLNDLCDLTCKRG